MDTEGRFLFRLCFSTLPIISENKLPLLGMQKKIARKES